MSIAFGTYKLTFDETYQMVLKSICQNCCNIDTAQLYRVEKAVGLAIKDSKVDRNSIFLTTKISIKNIRNGYDCMEASVNQSLIDLDTTIDLLLLHGYHDMKSWLYLETIYEKYKNQIKYIGVSNYNCQNLKNLLGACKIKPYTNQIELSPFFYRKDLIDICDSNQINITAHTIFSQNKLNYSEMDALTIIANKYKKNIYQIIIKFFLQQNISIIFGTKNIHHMLSNLSVNDFIIDDSDINSIKIFNCNYVCFKQHL
jgi:diketogulonate reductase-like aldo/keto reductase